MVIAGLKGGSGKTTLAIGLSRVLREKGFRVVPFKKGPDYIDAGWLAASAGHSCYNLDPFLMGQGQVLLSFFSHADGADVSMIEGNRGIFDGMDEEGTYSTAELAKMLRAPVILILDCSKVTRTTAAMVLGAQRFDEELEIRGVVLNQIAGRRHESVISKSIERYCGIPVLGAIPRFHKQNFPERHMGLVPFQEHPEVERAIGGAARVVKEHVDVDAIKRIADEAQPLGDDRVTLSPAPNDLNGRGCVSVAHCAPRITVQGARIGVVRDSAFQFYYPENIEELRARGARIVEISALASKELPDIDVLYIGGGFPETHAIALAGNASFRDSVKRAVMEGLPVYAECGGLMYLGKELVLEGTSYPMAGIFPLSFCLEKRPQAHGYTVAEVVGENPFYPEGTVLNGHEFHYSRPVGEAGLPGEFRYAFRMRRGQGIWEQWDGLCFRNVLATYTHLHALGAKDWVEGMARRSLEYRKGREFQKA